ncbi:hypothetical protein [Streptomyces sp. NPDC054863]
MSYPAQPPQQPGGNPYAQGQPPQQPGGGNPFAQGQQYPQAPGQYGQQQPGQFPQQGGQFGGGFPPPAPARRGNVGLGLLAGFVVALVAAGVYGAIMGAVEAEVGYAAVGVGLLIGFVAGKVGGFNPAIAVVSALLALVAVYAGQILGYAIFISKEAPIGVMEILTQHFGELNTGWKTELDFMSFVFFALGAVGAVSGAKKAS